MAAKCDSNYRHADWSFYRFDPSTAAAVIFIVLFSITTIVHVFQMIKTRTWYMLAFCLGGISEIAGYVGRAINSTEDPGCWTLGPYVVQSVLLLIAPALMAASIYMILSRVILLTEGEVHAVIRRRWLTKIFVVGDIISIELQSAGGSMMSGANEGNNLMKIGEYVIIGGLFFQLAIFGIFIVVVSIFHRRMNRSPTDKSLELLIRWRHYLTTLYVTSGFIWVRSLFRVIEYLDGNDGYLMRTEAFMFVFDATLIWIVTLWMNWYHPSEIGLLLRNEIPVTNGFELLPFRPRFEKIRS
ncbi:RTA1 like protein-domain-containing protein [Fusarium redolens]|uniref:RTA1 like protein-domain-containing protein n=1 Tax=Fusarium redolens TaxID=48865 RepID=A0A9P9FX46_FUSRE|nr:RTA1 like protein-domain-containing protein [Fusarium redolens]KAH7207924.1 RTA1 like protein-domain-containing protein [Fusarium redolens]